ncbi:MAG: DMSO reductase, partial [Betaproteobacteria bacterium]
SFFHLGRPERAWRSAAMWRTSWLSREVIVLPLFMAAVAAFGMAHTLRGAGDLTLALGAAGLTLALLLFVCTGMIYACLPFLQEWHTPLTVINYTLFGCASGFMLATAWAATLAPALVAASALWTVAFTLAALLTRSASLARNARLRPKSTLQTAIGIKHPRIAQKSEGFMGGSFNTREFFHARTAGRLRAVKWGFLLLVFPVPLVLLAAGVALASSPVLAAAFALQYLGLVAERWFFFAQAKHPQNLYYQAIS